MIYVALLSGKDAGVFDNLDDCLGGYEECLDSVQLVKADTIQEAKRKLWERYSADQLFRMGLYDLTSIRLNRHYRPNG